MLYWTPATLKLDDNLLEFLTNQEVRLFSVLHILYSIMKMYVMKIQLI